MSDGWLVVGLGNPGRKYAATRHNVGYLVADALLARSGARLKRHKGAPADVATVRVGGTSLAVVRSRTYMNDTGAAVGPVATYYGVPPERVIAVHDELDLDFGGLRVKLGGGLNGHNGLKSIKAHLGTPDYLRVRVGIGRPPGRQDAASFVLSPYSSAERKDLGVHVEEAADAVESLVTDGLIATQNTFNR